MNVYYDSKKKKAKSWVKVMFYIVPIVVTVLGLIWAKTSAEKIKKEEQMKQEEDIFEKF